MKKGYDPYNKPTAAKPKPRPNPYKAGPNNPHNNAGPKVRATSSAKGGRAAVSSAQSREFQRAYHTKATGPNSFDGIKGKGFSPRVGEAQFRAAEAGSGMASKNAAKKTAVDAARRARPSKIGWARAGGAAKKGSAVKWGTGGAKVPKPSMLGKAALGKAASVGSKLLKGAGAVGAVVGAAQAGYAVGTALNNKFNISSKMVDYFSPKYDPNAKGRSRTLTKTGSYDSPALKSHLASKKKKGR